MVRTISAPQINPRLTPIMTGEFLPYLNFLINTFECRALAS